MLKTASMLDELVEKNKDLDPAYVNNKLEKYDDLVQYYSILHTKQYMDDTNVELNECWELTKAQFQEEMQKNLVAHKREEVAYRRHLSTCRKTFPYFIYRSLDSLELSSLVEEVEEVEYSGVVNKTQPKESQKLRGGRHDTPIGVFEE